MFGRLSMVRIRSAERALREGRLDEAHRVAAETEIRDNRRGADLLRKVTDKLIERARAHFAAERFSEALLDLAKAEAGGVRTEDVAELRGHVRAVAEEVQRQDRVRRQRLDAVRQRIDAGSLDAGKRLLDEAATDHPDVHKLEQDLAARQREAAEAVRAVEKLLAQGQLAPAIQRFARAKALNGSDEQVLAMEATIGAAVFARVREALREGRLGQGRVEELRALGHLAAAAPERRELEDAVRLVRQAGQALREQRFDDARRCILSAGRLLPGAEWIATTAEQLEAIDDLWVSLRSGPLGDDMAEAALAVRGRAGARAATPVAGSPSALDETVALNRRAMPAGDLPSRLHLLIDGGGSYLLCTGDRVTIGRAASTDPADVPIFSDLRERHAEIARVGDDYFLMAAQEVEVNGRPTRQHLLQDGDRVALARSARVTFRLPSRRSGSAVLECGDTTRLPHGVRRVVLFAHNAMLGVGPTVHVQCAAGNHNLVLFERAGRLWLRPEGRGHAGESQPLDIGAQAEVAGASLTVKPWDSQSAQRLA